MPVYNGEKYLKESIDSILNQSFKNFEFIIVNDGSTDKTEEIILSYDDGRIRYVKNKVNLQIVKTLNKGITLAKGKYIARMDADDISLPERFEKQFKFMEANHDIDVCGTWVNTFGFRESVWKCFINHEEIKVQLLFNSPLAHPSVFFRRTFFKDFQYNSKANKAEDYFLWVQSIENKKFSNIPCSLLMYRLHENQTDRSEQRLVTNKIRAIMLKKVGCEFNRNELEVFFKIASYQSVSIKSLEVIFKKISKANIKSGYLNQYVLKNIFKQYFWSVINVKLNKGLLTILDFQRSSLNQLLSFSYVDYAKFYLKCLIR
ncbi:glycosyltransferase family 2 protein [Methylophilaceae bacterium Uisw_099_01]